ncbi:MAG: type II secretion system protein [Sulfurovum sp.]
MHYTLRKAFTQIELIFVMVIVGILAVVAIPRLAASRDDAHAAKCTQEAQRLISEISQSYTSYGYSHFSTLPIEEMTNIGVGITEGDGISSAKGSVVSNGIYYMCDSQNTIEVKGIASEIEYNLTVRDLDPGTPASKSASELIRKLNGISEVGSTRVYTLQ